MNHDISHCTGKYNTPSNNEPLICPLRLKCKRHLAHLELISNASANRMYSYINASTCIGVDNHLFLPIQLKNAH